MFPMVARTRNACAPTAPATLQEMFVRALAMIGARWHWNARFPRVVKIPDADVQKEIAARCPWHNY